MTVPSCAQQGAIGRRKSGGLVALGLLVITWQGSVAASKANAQVIGAPAEIIALKCKCRPILKAVNRKIGMKWKWKF